MDKMKAITNIPGWSELLNSADKVTTSSNAYAMVPLIYRCTRLRCDSIADVPVSILRGEDEVGWPFPTDLNNLIWKTEASLLLEGAAYWLKESNKVRPTDLMFLNIPDLIKQFQHPVQPW